MCIMYSRSKNGGVTEGSETATMEVSEARVEREEQRYKRPHSTYDRTVVGTRPFDRFVVVVVVITIAYHTTA